MWVLAQVACANAMLTEASRRQNKGVVDEENWRSGTTLLEREEFA